MGVVIVDVVLVGWEQECCGVPFEIGQEVIWSVVSRDLPGAPRRRFLESHHGLDLPGASGELKGVVREIVEFRAADVAIPGSRGRMTDPSNLSATPVVGVTGDSDVYKYVVVLEVDDSKELPAVFLDDTDERIAAAAAERDREVETWTRSPRGRSVRTLLNALRAEHGEAITITEGSGGAGVTIEPHRSGASPLLWSVSDDEITVEAGAGTFTVEDIDELAEFAAAVAAGRIGEERKDGGTATVVANESGEDWVDAVPPLGDGTWLVRTSVRRRLETEPRRYEPWA